MGGDGNDSLIGGNGNDTLEGGDGKDTLVGDGGSDPTPGANILHGGNGLDSAEILDDSESGFTYSGSWSNVSGSGFNEAELSATAGSNSTATWSFGGLVSGAAYDVYVAWTPQAGASTAAPFSVVDGATTTTFSLDQSDMPSGTLLENSAWVLLDTFHPSGSSLVVKLSDAMSGTVLADAVRLVVKGIPHTAGLPNVSMEESASDSVIDLSQYFSDDAPNPQFVYSVVKNTDPALVSPGVFDSVLNIAYTPGLTGSSTVKIRATDNAGAYIESEFTISVTPMSNHAPTVTSGFDEVDIYENSAATTIDLASHFNDEEELASSLTYSVSGDTNPSLFSSANIVDGQLILSLATNKVGIANLTITATDDGGKSTSTAIKVNVQSIPPDIENIHLLHDTGNNTADHVTTDSTIVGEIIRHGNTDTVLVQLDLNGDGVFDGSALVSSDDTFTYVPTGLTTGTHIFTARAIDSFTNTPGEAVSLSFNLVEKTGPSISSLSLAIDEGTGGAHITSNSEIDGSITADGPIDNQRVEFEYNGDSIVDGIAYTDEDGSFSFSAAGLTVGQTVTFNARGVTWDASSHQYLYGAWNSIIFQYIDPPTPTVSMSLADDTGTPSDSITTDPAITGSLSFLESTAYLPVQFDYNGDGIADGSTVTDDNGHFLFNPSGLTVGDVTIRARAAIFNQDTSSYVYGDWATLSFTLDLDPLAIPGQSTQLSSQQQDATSIEQLLNDDLGYAISVGLNSLNAVTNHTVSTSGNVGSGISEYDPNFLMHNNNIPALGNYDFQCGYLPVTSGIAPPIQFSSSLTLPSNASYSGTLTLSNFGAVGSTGSYSLHATEIIVQDEHVDTARSSFKTS